MEELKMALSKEFPAIDFSQKDLVDKGILDSLSIVSIIALIEDKFGIEVSMEYIQPTYFQSLDAMWEMIQELQ